jgi:hypothetical protein
MTHLFFLLFLLAAHRVVVVVVALCRRRRRSEAKSILRRLARLKREPPSILRVMYRPNGPEKTKRLSALDSSVTVPLFERDERPANGGDGSRVRETIARVLRVVVFRRWAGEST